MGYEHILFIFECETVNFERKQMFMITIFVTRYQAFDLKMFWGIFFIYYALKSNSISFGNSTTSLITEGDRNLLSKAGDSVAQGDAVPPLGEVCMAQRARHPAEDQKAALFWICSKASVTLRSSLPPFPCLPSSILGTYAICSSWHETPACRAAATDCWVPHKVWKHPDLAIRTQTCTEEPVLSTDQAS